MDSAIDPRPPAPAIASARAEGTHIHIAWSDGTGDAYHFVWLRDNCFCPHCGDPAIWRKTLRLADLPLDIAPERIEAIRDRLAELNVVVEDSAGGSSWHWK